jgi:hypothetical protein
MKGVGGSLVSLGFQSKWIAQKFYISETSFNCENGPFKRNDKTKLESRIADVGKFGLIQRVQLVIAAARRQVGSGYQKSVIKKHKFGWKLES